MSERDVIYVAQPKQVRFHNSRANEILTGGAAGGGKSMSLRWEAFKWCSRINGLQAYLFRRTFPELEKNHIIPSLAEFPRRECEWNEGKKRWTFRKTGAMIHMSHCQHEKDVFALQGAEIHWLGLDESTHFTQFMYEYLLGRVRCPLPIPEKWRHKIPGAYSASNPGGVSHGFFKTRFVKFAAPFEVKRAPKAEGGMLRQYIPATLADNPKLSLADPQYIHRLEALPEPYRTAYLKGDWDIFIGQMFAFTESRHVIEPIPVPEDAPLYWSFDWGYGKPYHAGYWWVDADGRVYLFDEIYGCVPGQPDTGLRHSDDQIAEIVVEREKSLGIWDRKITRLCDPTCFNKKPNYMGGGQGPSTAEVFAKFGINMIPGDAARLGKVKQMHMRLRIPVDPDELPMMVAYNNCTEFIRTIQLMQADPHNPELYDDRLECHPFDSAAHIAQARPIGTPVVNQRKRKEWFE
jgi:hypothetical protein